MGITGNKVEVWYEIYGYYSLMITRRLVSSETACYVFHPNGRKSAKTSIRGTDWFHTFAEAKAELIRRAEHEIELCHKRLEDAEQRLRDFQALEDKNEQAK